MKAKDLRDRSTEDLVELRDQLQKDLFGLRMKNWTNQLDDTSQLGKTKRDVARIEGILHARRIEEAAGAGSASENEATEGAEP